MNADTAKTEGKRTLWDRKVHDKNKALSISTIYCFDI